MLCNHCKSNTVVIDGVDNKDTDETYRLRVCPRCGRSYYTVEFPIEVNDRFKKDWLDHHKEHKKVQGKTYYSPDGVKQLLNSIYGLKKKNKEKK